MSWVEKAQRFAADYVDAQSASWELDRRLPIETFRLAADAGFCGLLVGPDADGAGLGPSETANTIAAIAAADMGFAFSLVCHNNLAGAIYAKGTEFHRSHLPSMLSGETVGAFLLTEPGAGSDAANIATSVVKSEGGWRLSGEKAWVTNGTEAGVFNVYAQTAPGSGPKGIAAFLVTADQPGVIRRDAYEMLGAHSTGTASFTFDNVELGDEQLFLRPGEAFPAAMAAIDIARVIVAHMVTALTRRSLSIAVEGLKSRTAFGHPLADQQGLRWMLADVATNVEAAQALAAQAAVAYADGDPDVRAKAAHAKKFATRIAFDGINDCMQALGAAGFRHDQPLARHLAGAKMAHYLDGTTEIQNVVIARSLFG